MGQWLNRLLFIFILSSFAVQIAVAQEEEESKYKDYKDKDQFKSFYKRRKVIGAWQINQLKTGALVVRLKTNKKLIDALNAQGKTQLAREKAVETFVINKNTMMAYINHYNFSKLYFIYSSSSDSLLKGAKTGIFLDTNLQVDPNIVMKESYYLIGERDYAYNSSIGFIPEDSAQFIKENGNPVREMGVVIKNKYGHQLKMPFPYTIKDKTFSDLPMVFLTTSLEMIGVGIYLSFYIEDVKQENQIRKQYSDKRLNKERFETTQWIKIQIKKQYTYNNISKFVSQLNLSLKEYYQATPPPDLSRIDAETKKLLY